MAGTSGWLLVVEDPLGTVSDQREFLEGVLVAGRSRQCDLILPSESVSRRHARFSIQGGQLYVEDLGSSNGLWIGDRRVLQPVALEDGDLLRLGEFRIRIRAPQRPVAEEVRLRLVGRSPGVLGQVTEMDQEVMLVGRGRDCSLVLLDPSVSRNHARLLMRLDGTAIVEDLDSANGVFVNDSRIRVRTLSHGDRLRFGDVEFHVELPQAGTVRSRRGRGRRRAWLVAGLAGILAALGLGGLWWFARGESAVVSETQGAPSSVPIQAGPRAATANPEEGSPGGGSSTPSAPVPAMEEELKTLEETRRLLEQRRIDEARTLVQGVLRDHPLDPEVVRLGNRIERERLAAEALAASDRDQAEGRLEAALQGLFSIPNDSVFSPDVRARLKVLRAPLERERNRACRAGSRTVACIRWKALVQKVEAASR